MDGVTLEVMGRHYLFFTFFFFGIVLLSAKITNFVD